MRTSSALRKSCSSTSPNFSKGSMSISSKGVACREGGTDSGCGRGDVALLGSRDQYVELALPIVAVPSQHADVLEFGWAYAPALLSGEPVLDRTLSCLEGMR